MNRCKHCGSAAINPGQHGREPLIDLDLCDVCYWRKRADVALAEVGALRADAKERLQDIAEAAEVAREALAEERGYHEAGFRTRKAINVAMDRLDVIRSKAFVAIDAAQQAQGDKA